jgi:hypothetical protein
MSRSNLRPESALLRRWKRRVASDEEMSASVHKDALRLLSGIRLFVEAREKEHIQSIIMDTSLVCLGSEKSLYIS